MRRTMSAMANLSAVSTNRDAATLCYIRFDFLKLFEGFDVPIPGPPCEPLNCNLAMADPSAFAIDKGGSPVAPSAKHEVLRILRTGRPALRALVAGFEPSMKGRFAVAHLIRALRRGILFVGHVALSPSDRPYPGDAPQSKYLKPCIFRLAGGAIKKLAKLASANKLISGLGVKRSFPGRSTQGERCACNSGSSIGAETFDGVVSVLPIFCHIFKKSQEYRMRCSFQN